MSIILLLVIIAVVVAAIYFRSAIANVVVGVGYVVAGTFARAWPAMQWIFIIAVAVGILGWIAFFALVVGLGMYANSPISAFVILVLFPMWFLAFIMPPFVNSIWIFGPVVRIVRFVFTPILTIAAVFLLIGIWSPTVSQSIDRASGDMKQSVANGIDKRSAQSEAEAGIFCSVTEDTYARVDSIPMWPVEKGTTLRVVNTKGQPADEDTEGMTKVMLPDRFGHFDKGRVGYIPSRLINWDWKGANALRKAEVEVALQQEKDAKLPYEKVVSVKYRWDDSWPGLDTLPAGKYEITAISSDFVFKWTEDGKKKEVRIGPEGIKGRVNSQDDLPLPSAHFGALIVKCGDNQEWELVGNKTLTIELNSMSYVRVARNVLSVANDYNNSGGDTIKIKRSGQ